MSTLNIIVLGDCGVGKSTLVSSLHSEEQYRSDATLFDDSPYYIPTAGIRFVTEGSKFHHTLDGGRQLSVGNNENDGGNGSSGNCGDSSTKCRFIDTSGSEAFHILRAGHFKRSHAAIVMFDSRSAKSLESALDLLTRLKQSVPIDVVAKMPVLLLGNKVDLARPYHANEDDRGSGSGAGKQLKVSKGAHQGAGGGVSEQELIARAARLNIPYIGLVSAHTGQGVADVYRSFRRAVVKSHSSGDSSSRGGQGNRPRGTKGSRAAKIPQQQGFMSLLTACVGDASSCGGGQCGNDDHDYEEEDNEDALYGSTAREAQRKDAATTLLTTSTPSTCTSSSLTDTSPTSSSLLGDHYSSYSSGWMKPQHQHQTRASYHQLR